MPETELHKLLVGVPPAHLIGVGSTDECERIPVKIGSEGSLRELLHGHAKTYGLFGETSGQRIGDLHHNLGHALRIRPIAPRPPGYVGDRSDGPQTDQAPIGVVPAALLGP